MSKVVDFFNFNILITPYIIGVVYIFGAIVVPIYIFYVVKSKLNISKIWYKWYLVGLFVVLEIFWRIFCEFFMVYFKIYLAL